MTIVVFPHSPCIENGIFPKICFLVFSDLIGIFHVEVCQGFDFTVGV